MQKKTLIFLTGAKPVNRLPFIAGLHIFDFPNIRPVETIQDEATIESFETCLEMFKNLDVSDGSKLVVFGFGPDELLQTKLYKQSEILKLLEPLKFEEIKLVLIPEFSETTGNVVNFSDAGKLSKKIEQTFENAEIISDVLDCENLETASEILMMKFLELLKE